MNGDCLTPDKDQHGCVTMISDQTLPAEAEVVGEVISACWIRKYLD